MDITKIEEAKDLFELRRNILHAYGVAIQEYGAVTKKHFRLQYLDVEKLDAAIKITLEIYFNELKTEVEAKIIAL